MTAIIHAHTINATNPGTYNTELNKILAANKKKKMPTIIIPEKSTLETIFEPTISSVITKSRGGQCHNGN